MASPASPAARPPAIWAAFERQGAWRDFVIALQFGVIGLLLVVILRLAHKDPDVVVVAPDGKSTYVAQSTANAALVNFLAEQKHLPAEVTIVQFTREFLNHALGMDSATVQATWPQALSVMAPALRDKVAAESNKSKFVESIQVMEIRTDLGIDDIMLVERTKELIHVNAKVSRVRVSTRDDTKLPKEDLSVDVVLSIVPRTLERPDALEVLEWRVHESKPGGQNAQ